MKLFNMYMKLFIQYSSRLFNSCNTLLSSIIQRENEACVKEYININDQVDADSNFSNLGINSVNFIKIIVGV